MRLRTIPTFFLLTSVMAVAAIAQDAKPQATAKTPQPTPAPIVKMDLKNLTAEQLVEVSIVSYAYPTGRLMLNQIRKTTIERGTTNYTAAGGLIEKATYQRYVIRGESLAKEKIRLDQDFPNARYALVLNDDKIHGVYNNTVFPPSDVVAKRFENQIVRGLEGYLRYRENESKIELAPREKLMGVDYYVVDITDKKDRKTRYYVSAKSYRVMMITYEENGVKYRRRFYDYNYAQGTLVPSRTVLWANDKIAEESEIGTITYGQKVDEEIFKSN